MVEEKEMIRTLTEIVRDVALHRIDNGVILSDPMLQFEDAFNIVHNVFIETKKLALTDQLREEEDEKHTVEVKDNVIYLKGLIEKNKKGDT